MDTLLNALPAHARDLRLNLQALLRDVSLTPQQRWGTMLACALAARNPTVIAEVALAADEELSPEAAHAARAAASIMAMNNVYYRFLHLVSDPEYRRLPAGLRMQVIGRPGVDRVDFELWCLAVSVVHGCGMCIDSHEQAVRKAGMGLPQVQQAVRIAAVIHAVAATLDGQDVAVAAAS